MKDVLMMNGEKSKKNKTYRRNPDSKGVKPATVVALGSGAIASAGVGMFAENLAAKFVIESDFAKKEGDKFIPTSEKSKDNVKSLKLFGGKLAANFIGGMATWFGLGMLSQNVDVLKKHSKEISMGALAGVGINAIKNGIEYFKRKDETQAQIAEKEFARLKIAKADSISAASSAATNDYLSRLDRISTNDFVTLTANDKTNDFLTLSAPKQDQTSEFVSLDAATNDYVMVNDYEDQNQEIMVNDAGDAYLLDV